MKTIDLFAGAGGLSLGFKMSGFTSIFANEFEVPALATFRNNNSTAITNSSSIVDLNAATIREDLNLAVDELDVLLGGPPCQGFSTYGQRNETDERNALYLHYLRFLEEFRPKFYVIENVIGILSMSDGAIVADILSKLGRLGYSHNVWTLDAADYGVPQHRKRVFITGGREGAKIYEPHRSHSRTVTSAAHSTDLFGTVTNQRNPHVTVRDAISDLPDVALKPKETQRNIEYSTCPRSEYQAWARRTSSSLAHHSAKQMLGIRHLRLALMHPGDYGTKLDERLASGGLPDELVQRLLYGDRGQSLRNAEECRTQDREKEHKLREMLVRGRTSFQEILDFIDAGGFANKYRRLSWDRPSHTLVAHMARDCSDFVHPEIDRFITVREAARLQSFPDNVSFVGSQFSQFRQIGNAVPPLLGAAVANSIKVAIGVAGHQPKARAA